MEALKIKVKGQENQANILRIRVAKTVSAIGISQIRIVKACKEI